MQRIAHAFSRTTLCCSSLALLTLPALAGTPEALNHVPSDAQAVIVVPDLGELLDDLMKGNAMLGEMASPEVMMGVSMIRGMPGVNLKGSMVTVLSMEDAQQEPDVVMLIPVSDFGDFTMDREPVNGVVEYPLPDGGMMYARDTGAGFAVFGPVAEQVKNYNANGGNLTAHTAMLGKAGGRIADHNDLFIYVNIPQFSDQIDQGLREMEAQGEMIEMMGGAEAAQSFDQMMAAMKTIANDAMSMSAGLNIDLTTGMSLDFGMQFKDASDTAGYFNNNGDAGKYFAKVPNMDYFMAASYDMSGAGIQKFIGQYMELVSNMDTTGMLGAMNMDKLVTGVKGGVQVVGASDNVMGGLFTNTLYYAEVDSPGAYIDAMREMYKGMGDSPELEQAGLKVEASVDAEPIEIDGVKAYGYQMSMDMTQFNNMDAAGGMGMNPAMMMQMMFGASGPTGYLAQSGEHGLIATLAQNPTLLSKAAKAANGENTMAEVAAMKRTASMLPDNRVMEMYIAADHLANTAGPMAMMFGLIPEFEPVESLPPLGMGLTADGGGMLFRTVVPIQTINKAMKMVQEIEQGQQQQNNEMEF